MFRKLLIWSLLISFASISIGCAPARRVVRRVAQRISAPAASPTATPLATATPLGESSSAPVLNVTGDNLTVANSPNYNVQLLTDVKYGEGLSHTDWNSTQSEPIDLLLDLYLPEDEADRLRPAVVFIHGGGFRGGDKGSKAPRDMVTYFAERGFVGISINYRLLDDYGTLPAEMEAAIESNPNLSNRDKDSSKASYAATRDAKAAIRWIYANGAQYNIDTTHITVIGGSAGSFAAVALAVTEPEDFTNELSVEDDPTLSSTNLGFDSNVHTVVEHWGSPGLVDVIELTYGHNRWDRNDTPLSIVHGTEDPAVPFSDAESLRDRYQQTGAYYEFYRLDGIGHGAWEAKFNGTSLFALAFDFVVRTQNLMVME